MGGCGVKGHRSATTFQEEVKRNAAQTKDQRSQKPGKGRRGGGRSMTACWNCSFSLCVCVGRWGGRCVSPGRGGRKSARIAETRLDRGSTGWGHGISQGGGTQIISRLQGDSERLTRRTGRNSVVRSSKFCINLKSVIVSVLQIMFFTLR